MRKGSKVYAIEDIDIFPGTDPKPVDVEINKGLRGKVLAPKDEDGYYLVQFEGVIGSWFVLAKHLSTRKPKR
jgi:hypothetical protein